MNNAADQPYFANNRQYRQAPPPPSAILLQKLSNGMNNMQQMAGGLSANAPEFVPQQKFGAAPMNGNFNSHTHQQAQQQQQFQQPQHYNRQPQQQTHHHQQQQQQQQQPQHHFGNDFRNLPNLMNTLSVQQHLQQQQPQSNQQQQALVQQQQQQQHHFHHNHHNHNVNNRNQNHYRGKGGGLSGNSVQNRLHRPHQQQHSHQHHNVNNHHHQHQPQQQQQQQPHHHHQDSSHGATTNGTPDGGEGGGSGGGESAHSEQELLAIGFIETVIQELSDDPGTYDNISRKVLNIYEDYQNNEFVLSNVMEIVFKRSIEEQNFRYMGAKLYGLFDLLAPNQKSLFRSLLSFKLDYHQTEMLDFLQNDQVKVRGTALFLAELYMQLRNDGTRLKIVAESIVLTIKQLLNKSTPENIKCICMTLKLAGYDLEFDYPQDMQFIMTTLEEKVDTLDVSTSRVLENVLQLQKQKWGRKTESSQVNGMGSSSSSPMHKFDLRASDEPVFYGPDGQVLSEEESSFLTSHMMDGYDGDLNAFDESPYPFAEMDEETEKAFEDFLKMSRK